MLDLVAHGPEGHGPVHLLLVSAAEQGFAWDGVEQGRLPFSRLGCFLGLSNIFRAIFQAWQIKVSAQLEERKGVRGAQFLDVKGSSQLLISSHLRERDKMLLRSILSGVSLERVSLGEGPG